MLELIRTGNEVTYNGTKLTIIAQASKGPNNEQVKIAGLPGANGRSYISLSKLKPGLNKLELDVKTRALNNSVQVAQKYRLTSDEQAQVDKLQNQIDDLKAQINDIVNVAKARYVEAPKDCDPSQLTEEERKAAIEQAEAYLNYLRITSK